ncbi:MAG: hypothetical protein RL026_1338 [Pseudomonadota bacterium]|jgi:D-alanyl-D-alanine carboxypeptidase (penicillin-binding protein 5/6)
MMRATCKCRLLLLPAMLAWAAATSLAQAQQPEPTDPYPATAGASYVVAVNDRLVWARELDTPRAPASLTKLLSAIVILESDWDPEAIVTVSRTAAAATGARIGLRAGERLYAGDLLTGMIVRSGNDACTALAEHAAGSVKAFVARMNQRAVELGMVDSHFGGPCGLDVEGQRSTARDLLRLAQVSITYPEIAEAGSALTADFRTLGGRRIRFGTTNRILKSEPEVVGLKTGFTNRAGKCLIALAQRGAHKVWIVLLSSQDRWFTASNLVTQGLNLAERQALALGDEVP